VDSSKKKIFWVVVVKSVNRTKSNTDDRETGVSKRDDICVVGGHASHAAIAPFLGATRIYGEICICHFNVALGTLKDSSRQK
jgi:hypothetical protein